MTEKTEHKTDSDPDSAHGWVRHSSNISLDEVNNTVGVPAQAGRLRKFVAFAGPGSLVAVGYVDPGNWATSIAGGSRFAYTLLSVILIANLMAMLRQALSAKLGIVTGKDLAQASRDASGPAQRHHLMAVGRTRDHRHRPGRSDRISYRVEPDVQQFPSLPGSSSPPSTCCCFCCCRKKDSGSSKPSLPY